MLVLREWFSTEWHSASAIAGGAAVTLATLTGGCWAMGLVIGGASLTVAGGIGATINRRRVAVIKARAARAEAERDQAQDNLTSVAQVGRTLYRQLLAKIAVDLGLGPRERISIYRHDAGLPSFQLLSRHSSDPTLETAKSRSVYPDNQGIIGKAWREGTAVETSLPDPVGGDIYAVENHRRYYLPTTVTEGLAMKSRALAAVRFPAGSWADEPLGVLVLESLDETWDAHAASQQLGNNEGWYALQAHLRAMREHLPTLSSALKRGL